jgi:hypothetical protein
MKGRAVQRRATRGLQALFYVMLSTIGSGIADSAHAGNNASIQYRVPERTSTSAGDSARCSLKTLAAVDLVVSNHVLVPVTINDHPALMVLQTSDPLSDLFIRAVPALGLTADTLSKWTEAAVDKRRVSHIVSIGSLKIAGLPLAKQQLMINPLSTSIPLSEVNGRPVAGTLGIDALWPFDLELDLAHHKLVLYAPNHCHGHAVYWAEKPSRLPISMSEMGSVYFPVNLNGKAIEATISSDEEHTFLRTDASRALFGLDVGSAGLETYNDANGTVVAQSFHAATLSSGDLAVTGAQVMLSKPGRDCNLVTSGRPSGAAGYNSCLGAVPLVLGRDIIGKLRLYFAMEEKLIYFTPAEIGERHEIVAAAFQPRSR